MSSNVSINISNSVTFTYLLQKAVMKCKSWFDCNRLFFLLLCMQCQQPKFPLLLFSWIDKTDRKQPWGMTVNGWSYPSTRNVNTRWVILVTFVSSHPKNLRRCKKTSFCGCRTKLSAGRLVVAFRDECMQSIELNTGNVFRENITPMLSAISFTSELYYMGKSFCVSCILKCI